MVTEVEFTRNYTLIENLLALGVEIDYSVDGTEGRKIKFNLQQMENRRRMMQKRLDDYIKKEWLRFTTRILMLINQVKI